MDDLLVRGVENIIPSKEELQKLLTSGKKLNVYLGIDPTTTKIHLGHTVALRKLNEFAEAGHNVTFLIGDFTALVGDTSDKDSERPILTKEEIEKNFKTYKNQAQKVLDFSKVKIKYNSEWLSKLTPEDMIKLFRELSLGDFIGRELISKRMKEGTRVRLDEVIYPVLQGYDSYFMDTDVQIGGTDQTYNMQAGRKLLKTLKNKDSFIIAVKFPLIGTDGRKMSKSWGNAIWLDDEPFEIYRKVMSIDDDQILNYFELATNVPIGEIPKEEEVKSSPLEIKKKLANKIVSELHSGDDAKTAGEKFERVVQRGELPSDITEVEINDDIVIDEDFLVEVGLVNSKSEAKRLFDQNGVTLNGEKIKRGETPKDNEIILGIGKKMIKLKRNV
ncbi:MAG: Tyrosine-tRNA ligase [Candidatus Woesebacteria bacterium GW2011_GWB1_38_5b]|uniref:Tyrosine--tRNA ligase n=1 Tax=Candidatus Woesebacteria bacterium GW2011_GWB1_38_5b TaxID=1618569 RepID=A0A0G0KI75_9BACT|nr:MAG: Tyrosine-tRNA ligase [Candidatus Woesebacteria bacterium GW2011_GWB1_38_5b]